MVMAVRTSRPSTRTLGRVVLAAAAFLTTLGLSGAMAAAAPLAVGAYPPVGTPCALSWAAADVGGGTFTSADDAVLVGSGLGRTVTVSVVLYPVSAAVGSFRTDATGAFEAPVHLLGQRTENAWLTATSVRASCSTPAPPGIPGGGSGTGDPPPTTGSTTGPTTGSSAPSGGPDGQPGTNPTPTTGATSTSGRGTPTRSHGPGRSQSTTPVPSSSNTAPLANRTPPASVGPIDLNLPASVVVIIALLLLIAGGLAVILLTRRSG